MNFKKPTALTTVLSALLVLGIGSTAAFAVSAKPEDPVTVPEPEMTITTSETIPEDNSIDNNSETGEPEPVEPADIPDNTITLPLKWEDGLETQPEGYYIELQKTDENGEKIKRYIPISETFDSDFAGKYKKLLGNDYMPYGNICEGHILSREYFPRDFKHIENWKTMVIRVTFPPVKVMTFNSFDEILYPPNSNCGCSYEYHEDGSVTVYFFNSGDEPLDFENAKPREPKRYTHFEDVGDGIIAW